MRYGISDPCEYVPFLELSHAEYAKTQTAIVELFSSLSIEEKFSHLIENYRELVVDALRVSVRHTNLPDTGYDEFIDDIQLFNRRILNVLASARAYLDHVAHDLASFFDADHLSSRFKRLTNHSYDSSFLYRLLESLRNFVQHRSLPLEAIYHDDSWCRPDGTNHYRLHRLELWLNTGRMRDDSTVKASLRKELEEKNESIDLLIHVREYVAQLAEIHEELRDELTEIVAPHEQHIRQRVEQFAASGSETPAAVYLVHQDDLKSNVSQYHLDDKYSRRRQTLIRLYSRLGSLTRQFVTNAPKQCHHSS